MSDRIIVTEKDEQLSKLAEALAHPTRIAILNYILNQQSCLCKDLTARLPIVQSSVSQHLKKLKDAGLIYGNIEGTKTCYCPNLETIDKLSVLLNVLFKVDE